MSYNLLQGKKGIIFGALNEQSIAWKVAEKAVENGARITLSNTPVAVRMGEVSALAEKLQCEVIPADATSVEDLKTVFTRSMEVLGGQVDFVLHSIGMSPNVRKRRTYDDLDYDMLGKTLDISAISFHKMIQTAKKLNAVAEYGSILALSYVAAQRTFFGYNDMADAKALLESIARSFGYIYGREHHVRVNTISQSPTMTTAGSGVKDMDKLHRDVLRPHPQGHHAEPLPRWGLLQHGHEPQGNEHLPERPGGIHGPGRPHHLRMIGEKRKAGWLSLAISLRYSLSF